MNDSIESTSQPGTSEQRSRSKRRWPAFLLGFVLGGILSGVVVGYVIIPAQFAHHRTSARTSTGMNNLRTVGIAAMNFTSQHRGALPPVAMRDDQGEPNYSWRVALLEYIDGGGYFHALDLSQPADSEANRTFLAMPNHLSEQFQVPGSPAAGTLNSSFFAITGDETPFPPTGQTTLDDISDNDGQTYTMMFVEAADMGINWTSPQDIPFAALTGSPKDLRGKGPSSHRPDGGVITFFCDGHATILNGNIDPEVLRALATYRGKEELSQKY